MNKFEHFSSEELLVVAKSLVGEAAMYRDMVEDNVEGAEDALLIITNVAVEMLEEIADRRAVLRAEMDQLLMELNHGTNYDDLT